MDRSRRRARCLEKTNLGERKEKEYERASLSDIQGGEGGKQALFFGCRTFGWDGREQAKKEEEREQEPNSNVSGGRLDSKREIDIWGKGVRTKI